MILTVYLFIILLSLLVSYAFFRSQSAKLIDEIPGPTPLPLLGNGLMFNVSSEKLWEVFIQLINNHYPIVRTWIFNIRLVFVSHPDDMRNLLTCKKNIIKCKRLVYNGFKEIDSDGLILSEGEKWHQRRKIISPAFDRCMLKVYTQIINEHAKKLIQEIRENGPETELDIIWISKKLTLGIICEAAMGVELGNFNAKKAEEFRHNFNAGCDVIFYRALRPYIKNWMMKFLSIGRKQARAVASFRKFIGMIIDDRREYHRKCPNLQNVVDNHADDNTNRKKRLAIIDLLLSAEAEGLIDSRGIREEVETFMAAGYDTSGVAIAFALMLFAENKSEQDIARAEITHLLEKTGGELKMEDINSLKYFDRCIKEVLRLYPSGPLIGRHITDEIELGNYKIPQGTEVLMHIFHLHRNPSYWPDPHKFDPDRFLPENMTDRHPFAYLPFSSGLRACIGMKFAQLEMKIAVARILYNFYIVPVQSLDRLKFGVNITLMPQDTCRVKLISIDRTSTS